MKLPYILFVLLFFKAVSLPVYAQQPKTLTDSIAERITWAGRQKSATTLFVHFDKTIYSNNENVWFTAYLVKTNISGVHHTLSVALIRNDDRSVLAEAKYVMDKGLAFGNMFLPDSLPTGNYSFVCYTNLLVTGNPAALFVQPVTIKTGDTRNFIAKLSLTDSITPGMDSATVLLKAYTTDMLVKKAPVKYFIGDRAHPLYSGSLVTDIYGEAKINIPLKKITPAANILQVEIDNGKGIKNFSIKLPVYKKENIVKFYPEGGNLVEGATNTVGWEVTNNEEEPVMADAALYQNDQLLQTIKTNIYGMGKFFITPEKGSRYYIKLHSTATDSLYMLPQCLPGGIVITIAHALTADTLFVKVNFQAAAGKLILLVHDYRTTFINAPVVTSAKMMLIKIPLDEVPKGITTLTILDSLARPVAERLFFAHFDKRALLDISTDSASYTTRQKVTVKFKITDAAHKRVTGLVSIACVQNNRFDVLKTMNIESYTYLTNELAAFPFKKNVMGNEMENREFLEQLLLVKGWRRYTWQDVETAKATGSLAAVTSLSFKGKIVLNDKALKKPVQLNLKKFVSAKLSELEYISTDSLGRFELLPQKLISEPDRKFEISVNNERKEEYTVTVTDPYKAMNKTLAASLFFADHSPRSFTQSSQAYVFKNDEVTKTLKTVVVSARKDNRMYYFPKPGTNICGDYVCMYGILNCTNHPNDRFEPVVGRTYASRSPGSQVTFSSIYYGCTAITQEAKNEYLFSMEGIYGKKEFYVADLSKADISDPQYISTLYWNYAVLTNKNAESELSFYTSDIPGKFRIVIQGITTDNVVYGEYFFEVKEQ
jgi:hypothetical protein